MGHVSGIPETSAQLTPRPRVDQPDPDRVSPGEERRFDVDVDERRGGIAPLIAVNAPGRGRRRRRRIVRVRLWRPSGDGMVPSNGGSSLSSKQQQPHLLLFCLKHGIP